jgi:hypothetical protein
MTAKALQPAFLECLLLWKLKIYQFHNEKGGFLLMLKHNLHKVLLVLLSCFLIMSLSAPIQAAAPKKHENGALTSPPPAEDMTARYVPNYSTPDDGGMSTQSVWNPNHIYLSRGETNMGVSYDNDLVYMGNTYALQFVQQVGIQLTLQRWTGDYWVDVDRAPQSILYNTAQAGWSHELWVAPGYYYRCVGTHWIDHNGIHEDGVFYGNPKLY